MKPIVKSAFLLQYNYRRLEYKIPFKSGPENMTLRCHEHPIFILRTYDEVIEFLCKYTDFAKYHHGDRLAMKWQLKDACFGIDITRRKELQREIMADEYGYCNDFRFENEYYPEHYIHIHRLPLGVYRRFLKVDYI